MGYFFFSIGILAILSNLCFLDVHALYALTNSTLGEPISVISGRSNNLATNMSTTNTTADNITQKTEFLNRVLR
jgi:hypothetical protein